MMYVRALLTTSALLLALRLTTTSTEVQSTCKAIWLFRLPCTKPVSALVNQVKIWSTQKCYDSQEECMYEIIKNSSSYLEIRHTSPNTYKSTVMTFSFNPPAAPHFCKILVFSTASKNASSPNDYCLLYNLFSGSGLTHAEGHKEICNNAMCPSKQSATCNTCTG